jgi:hypothetical protein
MIVLGALLLLLAVRQWRAPQRRCRTGAAQVDDRDRHQRKWLVHSNATVMAVLLLVIVVIGKGVASF